MTIDGKQLKSASVPDSAITNAANYLKKNSAVAWTVDQDAGSQKLTNLGAPVSGTDAARLQDVQNIPWKQVCRVATTANITLSGNQTIDGVSITTERVLVKNQTTQTQNGIYNAAAGSWTRAIDADSTFELNGAVVYVDEGTINAGKRFAQTTASPTVGSSNIIWIDIGAGSSAAYPTTSNKNMTASVTTSDGNAATATTLVSTPANHSWIALFVNGVEEPIGDGDKTHSAYFSADGGTTARAFSAVTAGDTLYWVGSVAGYQLAATDKLDLAYLV